MRLLRKAIAAGNDLSRAPLRERRHRSRMPGARLSQRRETRN